MTENLYAYHRHMRAIAEADIAYIEKKDVQYAASWKQRGGIGAFFTIVRPWDRLERMLAMRDEWAYDIFDAIGGEGLAGPDGSIIACVRDLRRYLLLVEAHMTEVVLGDCAARNADVYQVEADRLGVTRREAKTRVLTATYGGSAETDSTAKSREFFQYGEPTVHEPAPSLTQQVPQKNSDFWLRESHRLFGYHLGGNNNHQVVSAALEKIHDLLLNGKDVSVTVRDSADVPRTPENGGQHASLAPWVKSSVSSAELEWYTRRAAGVFTLDVEVSNYESLPVELRSVYVRSGTTSTHAYVKIQDCPKDARDFYPCLRTEVNHKELEDLPAWQGGLYEWIEGETKYRIKRENVAWTER